jgi:hypothetical protein
MAVDWRKEVSSEQQAVGRPRHSLFESWYRGTTPYRRTLLQMNQELCAPKQINISWRGIAIAAFKFEGQQFAFSIDL